MQLKNVYNAIDSLAPFSLSEEYCDTYNFRDNSGIILDCGEDVKGVLCSLDLSHRAVEAARAAGANVIFTHHPAIFNPIYSLHSDEPLTLCARAGISVISAHLNLDAARGGIDEELMFGLGGSAGKLLHPLAEVVFIAQDIGDHSLHVHPDHIFQNNSPDEMCLAVCLVFVMHRTLEEVLPLFKIVGRAVIHLFPAVTAIDQTGEQTCLTRLASAVSLLSDLLYLVKHFHCDDRLVCTVEDCLIFKGRFTGLFVPDGIGVGFEVDRTAGILFPL